MSVSQLTEREHRLILDILEVAEQKYFQQHEINPRAVFNLLKILSAYNEVLPKHGISATSESRMYNYLLHISRKYDPHGKDDWRHLIQNHRTLNSKSNTKMQSTYREGSVTRNIPTNHQQQDISEISEFNADPKNQSVSNIRLVSGSKIHTQGDISCLVEKRNYFMPKRVTRTLSRSSFDNKENIPISHNIMTGQLLSQKPTDRHMSFIEHSTQLAPCSKTILIGSEDRSQEEQLSMRMNQRASLAYQINLETKAFLILKATCLIHDEARNRLRAILKYCRDKFKKRFFGFIKDGVQVIKQQSLKKRMANKMYQNNTKRKIFKFFKILKTLQVKEADEHSGAILGNRLGLEFVMSMVAGSVFRQPQLKVKYQHFLKHGKFTELSLLWKVFGAAQPNDEQTLKTVIRHQSQNILRLIFSNWKKQSLQQRFTAGEFYAKKRKGQVLQVLFYHTRVQIDAKERLDNLEKAKQMRLLYRAFINFRDNCRYLRSIRYKSSIVESRSQLSTMIKYMEHWKGAMQNRKSQYIQMQEEKVELQETYETELKRLVFQEGFRAYYQWRVRKRQLTQTAEIYRSAQLKEKALKILVAKVLEKKKCEYISSKASGCPEVSAVFQKWREHAAVKIFNSCLGRVVLRTVLKKIQQRIVLKNKEQIMRQSLDTKLTQKMFKDWKKYTTQSVTERERKDIILQNYLLRMRKIEIIRKLLCEKIRNDKDLEQLTTKHPEMSKYLIKKNSQQNQWTSKKHLYNNLKSYYYLSKYFAEFKKYRLYYQNTILIGQKLTILKNYRRKRFFGRTHQRKFEHLLSATLENKIQSFKKLDALERLHLYGLRKKQEEIYGVMTNQYKKEIQNHKKSFALKQLKFQARKLMKQNYQAQAHRQTKLQQRTLLLLKSITIVCRQRKDKHQALIQEIRNMILKKSFSRLRIGVQYIQFGKVMTKLTKSLVGKLLKKKSLIRMQHNSLKGGQTGSMMILRKKLSAKIFIRRLKNNKQLRKCQNRLSKSLVLRNFMCNMYERLSDRKLLHIACHHYATQLLVKGMSCWLMQMKSQEKEPTQNINTTNEQSQNHSQIPSSKRHISDILNYYSK